MSLIDDVESDLEFILEDSEDGFGVELTFIDGDDEYEITGITNDIGFFIDPSTGMGVIGRTAEVSIRISSLKLLTNKRPNQDWLCEYTNKQGETWKMAIKNPPFVDRTCGIYLIILEAYGDGEA